MHIEKDGLFSERFFPHVSNSYFSVTSSTYSSRDYGLERINI